MKLDQFKLYLNPIRDGAFSQLRLFGPVITALPPDELLRLLKPLSSWTGNPVELVLPAELHTAGWLEFWADAISELPARHLHVRFTIKRPCQTESCNHVG